MVHFHFRLSGLCCSLAAAGILMAAYLFAIPGLHGQTTQFMGAVSTIAGNKTAGNSGNGGPATAAMLSATVSSATYDSYGNLYIADSGNKVVRVVNAATGFISVYAGGGTVCAGATDTAGDGCPATQAVLQSAVAVRIFRGDLYIVDSTDNRVRKVSLATGVISLVIGTGVGTGAVTYNQLAPITVIKTPQAIAFDSRGDIFVTQNGGAPRVDRIDALTDIVTPFAGTGTGTPKSGDGGVSTAATVNVPIGLAVDSHDNLYIADRANNCVRKVTVTDATATSGIISTYAGPQGSATTSGYQDAATGDQALFGAGSIDGMYFDAQDNLYLADNVNGRVREVAPPTNGQTAISGVVSTIAGNGVKTGTGNDGQYALNANLLAPYDVTIDASGDLVIADRQLAAIRIVRPVSPSGSVTVNTAATPQPVWANTVTAGTFSVVGPPDFSVGATTCTAAVTPLTGQACTTNLSFMPSLSSARRGGVVFTDSAAVSVGQPSNGIGVAPVASLLPGIISLATGSSSGTSGSSGDGGAASSALLNGPVGIAFDGVGNEYIADANNHEVRRISASTGTITRIAGTTGTAGYSGDGGLATSATLHSPNGVAVDGADDVYIADTGNDVIRRVDGLSGIITTIAGTGQAGYTGDNHLATAATLNYPTGVALGLNGVLYIADTGNNAVRTIGVRTGLIQTFTGNGVAGFVGDGGPALQAVLNAPTGVAVDNVGAVYIADTGNSRIREVDATGFINTVAGTGQAGFSGDGIAISSAVSSPMGLVVDASGAIYIADTGNNRVRVVHSGQLTTIAGTGTGGLSGNGGNANLATLHAPSGIALNSTNGLALTDTGNNQLRAINDTQGALSFPETSPTTSSPSQTELLLNSGNAALNIASVSVPNGFVEDISGGTDCNTVSLVVSVASTCTLQIHFAPTALVQYTGNLVVNDNALGQTNATQTVALTGLGKNVFQFTVTPPSAAAAGIPVSVTVKATNPNQAYMGTIVFSSSDPKATYSASYTFTSADNGTHVFSNVIFGTTGIQTLTVTDSQDANQSGTGSIKVTAGAAAKIAVQSGSGQSTNIATSFAFPLVAFVTDSYGNAVSGTAVTFTAPTSGPHAFFGTSSNVTTAVSNVAGFATTTVPITADSITGTYTVQGTITGVSGSASFTLTNTSNVPAGFTITPYETVVGTVLPGASSTQSITITPSGGFSATVSFACQTSDSSTSCTVTPSNAPGTDGTSQMVQLIFTTTGPARNGTTSWLQVGGKSTLVFALLGFCWFRRKGKNVLKGIALLTLAIVAATQLMGCTATTLSLPRTPSGNYTVTLTATSGSLTRAVTITYVVGGD